MDNASCRNVSTKELLDPTVPPEELEPAISISIFLIFVLLSELMASLLPFGLDRTKVFLKRSLRDRGLFEYPSFVGFDSKAH